jgi:hypothetical protein
VCSGTTRLTSPVSEETATADHSEKPPLPDSDLRFAKSCQKSRQLRKLRIVMQIAGFDKRSQFFIPTHNETLSVTAPRLSNSRLVAEQLARMVSR